MSIPQLVLVLTTRVMLGTGIGLLAAGKLGRKRRIAVGTTLFAIGALSTIPLALAVLGRGRRWNLNGEPRAIPTSPPIVDGR
jgi:hypothetical protein